MHPSLKHAISSIVHTINSIYTSIFAPSIHSIHNTFFLFQTDVAPNNTIQLSNTTFSRVTIRVLGTNNTINIISSELRDVLIEITGTNNTIILHPGTFFQSTRIIVKGNSCKTEIGTKSTFGGARIVNAGECINITIGEDCLFADNIEVWASDTHNIFDSHAECINMSMPIRIGNHVWVGAHSKILKGVTVGDGSVIGMGSLITKSIDNNCVCAGNPHRVIKSNISWDRE